EAFGREARGGCFLAYPAGFGRGPSGHSAVPWGLTVLMVLPACASANTEPPFTLGRATPEMLPSLKRRLVGERRSHRRVTGPFRSAYGSGLPGLCRDGVGLSPVSVISHCAQA